MLLRNVGEMPTQRHGGISRKTE